MCLRELARFVSCAARLYDSLEVERTHIIALTYEKHVELRIQRMPLCLETAVIGARFVRVLGFKTFLQLFI